MSSHCLRRAQVRRPHRHNGRDLLILVLLCLLVQEIKSVKTPQGVCKNYGLLPCDLVEVVYRLLNVRSRSVYLDTPPVIIRDGLKHGATDVAHVFE